MPRDIPIRIIACICALTNTGCALVWDDAAGTRHGIGSAWPVSGVSPDGITISGFDIIGLGLIATRGATGVTFGYSRERFVSLSGDAAVAVDDLQGDLATTRIARPSFGKGFNK